MGRRKKEPVLVPPEWSQTLRTKFLNAAFHHRPDALLLLATDGRTGHITAHDWAVRFDVDDTWIEDWARDTLKTSNTHPGLAVEVRAGALTTCFYPPPLCQETAADDFSYRVSGVRPPCKYSVGTLSGGRLSDDLADDHDQILEAKRSHDEALRRRERATSRRERERADSDLADSRTSFEAATQRLAAADTWTWFKTTIHADLEEALERYRQAAIQSGAFREVRIPSDLQLKIEVGALYKFKFMSPKVIGELPEITRDETVVYRWLKEVLRLLDLPMRAPGWLRNRASPLL